MKTLRKQCCENNKRFINTVLHISQKHKHVDFDKKYINISCYNAAVYGKRYAKYIHLYNVVIHESKDMSMWTLVQGKQAQ